MNIARKATVLAGALAILALSGCGGGGGGDGSGAAPTPPPPDPAPTPPTGGIGRNGIALGPVSTFGSIVVNGIHYDTAAAMFINDGGTADEVDLKVGQIVLVEGTIADDLSTGIANSVTFDDNVKGPVESINLPLGQLVVLGQLVLVSRIRQLTDRDE